MEFDDLEPGTKKPKLKDLEVMSIEALQEYIADLQAEIERAREAISQKEEARKGAESFFKS